MEQTLLIGNGISKLLNPGKLDWKNVLKEVTKEDQKLLGENDNCRTTVPYTHLYEDILLNDKYRHKAGTEDLSELKLRIKEHLKNETSKSSNKDFDRVIKLLLNLDLKNILSTNYEYCMENVLEKQDYSYEKSRQQTIYSTRRKRQYCKNDGRKLDFWHIHGELDYVKSIMLGYDHYCGSLTKISDYIKKGKLSDSERDESTASLKDDKDIHHIVKKCLLFQNGCDVECKTWMDTFFFSDVHIIGLGLDFQEIDLWWLLNKRYRYIKTAHTFPSKYHNLSINNHIYYYGKVRQEVKAALEAYGVNTKYANASEEKVNDWTIFYENLIAKIKENIRLLS